MGKYQINYLLEGLKSGEISARNDAIKTIIKGKINDEQIIIALKEVVESDTSMSVRNFARAALDVFGVKHSAIGQPLVEVPNNEVDTESSKINDNDQKNIERGNADRVNKSPNKWIFKAIGYFVLSDILFSILFELLWELMFRKFISFSVEYIYTYMPFVAIFALPLSVGLALRGEIQSPEKVKISDIFIRIATIVMTLFLCILFLAMFLVQ